MPYPSKFTPILYVTASFRPPCLKEETEVSPFTLDAIPSAVLLDLRRCAGLEDEDRLRAWSGEEPVVHVPDDLHRRLVDEQRLVAPELPLQALDVQQHEAVHRDPHLGILAGARGGERVLDDDLVLLAPPGVEPRARREAAAAEHALPAAHQHGVLQRRPGLGPLVRVLLAVAEEKDDLVVADQRDVVAAGGLRAGPPRRELGGAQVPEHVDAVAAAHVHRLAALLAPERPRLQLHLVGDRSVAVAAAAAAAAGPGPVDGDGEGLVDEALAPDGGDEARDAVDLGEEHRHRGALRRGGRRGRRPAGGGVVAGRRGIAGAPDTLLHLAVRLAGFGSLVHDQENQPPESRRIIDNRNEINRIGMRRSTNVRRRRVRQACWEIGSRTRLLHARSSWAACVGTNGIN